MNRKEFLKTVWKKGIKPLLILGVIFFCARFLVHTLSDSGSRKLILILSIGLALLILALHLLGSFIDFGKELLQSKLPDNIKFWLRVFRKVVNYFTPIVFGMLIYQCWKEDWKGTAIVLSIIVIERIREFIKEEKISLAK